MRSVAVLSFALCAACAVPACQAQAPPPDSQQTEVLAAGTIWPSALTAHQYNRLIYITAQEPQRRHACHVRAITPDSIVCSRGLRKGLVVAKDDVLVLIEPEEATRSHHGRLPAMVGAGIGMMLLGLIPGPASLVLLAGGGVVIFVSPIVAALPHIEEGHDTVIYRRLGPLPVLPIR